MAIERPQELKSILSRFTSERIAIALDVKGDQIFKRGWREQGFISALELVQYLKTQGVHTLVYTDIQRDGMSCGVDLEFPRHITEMYDLKIILAGGVHNIEDIRLARQAGMAGIIIGKALYDGRLNLRDALEEEKSNDDKTHYPMSRY